jgi:4-aminobutyrate aminotransferase
MSTDEPHGEIAAAPREGDSCRDSVTLEVRRAGWLKIAIGLIAAVALLVLAVAIGPDIGEKVVAMERWIAGHGVFRSQTMPSETAAILIEPVLGEGGFVPAPPRFLTELRRVCDEHGILLIADEIQSGFGRTGDYWAHTSSGITPDILLMAKAIASGMPLSAMAASRELMENFTPGSHGGTYGGGSAIAMSAAQATLQVIQQEGLVENSRRMGDHLTKRLIALQDRFPALADVRGGGLMVACELVDQGQPATELANTIQQKCLDAGLMLLSCGSYSNVIRWLPPLIVTAGQIDEAINIFESAL